MPTRFSRIVMTPMPRRKQIDVRRNKIVVADAGARRKKRGRRGVGGDELFVRSSETTMIGRGVGMTSGGAEIASAAGPSPINGVRPVSTVHEFSNTQVLPQGEEASDDADGVARSKTAF